MAVVLVFEGVTQEQYEESVRKLTGGKDRVESPADWPVEGLLAHIAGQGPTTFRVVDVWESEEAAPQLRREVDADHAGDGRGRATRGLPRARIRLGLNLPAAGVNRPVAIPSSTQGPSG